MIDKIGASAAADFTAADRQPPPRDNRPPTKTSNPEPPNGAVQSSENTRLVIERQEGVYVYKLIDRDTGRVIAAIPRTEIGKMAQSSDYGPGNLVSTTA